MASEVGQAYITIMPSARGFGSSLQRQIGGEVATAGAAAGRKSGDVAGRRFSSSFGSRVRSLVGPALGGALAYGAARVVKESVNLEASFSKTMNRVAASTGAPRKELEGLSQLALKLGGDTVFSANEASDAMLELAKGGLTSAQIRAGSLADTLTLAAAGDLELADAAKTTVQSMGAFNLAATDTKRVASALAGAANASAADVSDLTQALSQVGTEANSTGLSIEETTAALAAFSNAGIAGSDAGTSLKTFLTRIVPSTDKAQEAMASYGLVTYDAAKATKILAQDGIDAASKSYEDVYNAVSKYLVQQGVAEEGTVKLADATDDYLVATGIMRSDFQKANGEFKDLASIAGTLQEAFKGLSASEKSAALTTIFGSDARRAANVLIDEGEAGVRGYTRATSDLKAAEKMAGSAMKGTAGALERLSGATETAQLKIGRGLAPTVQRTADGLSAFLDTAPLERWARNFGLAAEDVWTEVRPLGRDLLELGETAWPTFVESAKLGRDVLKTMLPLVRGVVQAFNSLPDDVQRMIVVGWMANRMLRMPMAAGAVAGGTALLRGGAAAGGAIAGGAAARTAAAGAGAGLGARAATMARSLARRGGYTLLAERTATVGFDIFKSLDDVDKLQGALAETDDTAEGLRRRFHLIGGALAESNIGRYAEETGIDIDKLAWSMARFGTKGDYVKEVIGRLAKEGGFDKLNQHLNEANWFNATDAFTRTGSTLEDFNNVLDESGTSSRRQRQRMQEATAAGEAYWQQMVNKCIPATGALAEEFGLSSGKARVLHEQLQFSAEKGAWSAKSLRALAKSLGLNREETQRLIVTYGSLEDSQALAFKTARAHENGLGKMAGTLGLNATKANRLTEKILDQEAANRLAKGESQLHERQLRKVAERMGLTREQTQRLIDKYRDVPKDLRTTAWFDDVKAREDIREFRTYADGQFKELGNSTYAILVKGQSGHGRLFEADGGIVRYFAHGGVEKHVAQIARKGVTRVWNEPETGGELYAPLAPSKRPRSRRILEQGAQLMGGRVEWYADGGIGGRFNTKVRTDFSELRQVVRETVRALRFTGGAFPHDYTRVGFRGVTLDKRTALMVRAAETLLGGQRFDMTQGSYNAGGVAASGGTHDGGGAFDADSPFSRAAIIALRKVGFAAWRRYPNQGPWGTHIHSIDPLNRMLSAAARSQAVSFRAGGDGLGGSDYEPRPAVLGNVLGGGGVAGQGAKAIVREMAAHRGWGGAQWRALHELVRRESSWNPNAANPNSSARGLFQKMTSLHGPVESTVAGQARWGLNYIASRYGSPIGALRYHNAHGSYDNGGWLMPGAAGVNLTRKPEAVLDPDESRGLKALAAGPQRRSRRAPLRIELDVGGGRVLTGIMRDEIDAHEAFRATTRRMN